MLATEVQRLREILEIYDAGNSAGARWGWNPETKKIEPLIGDDPNCLPLTAEDLGHAGDKEDEQRITVWADDVEKCAGQQHCVSQPFYHWRDSNVFTAVKAQHAGRVMPGTLVFANADSMNIAEIGNPGDRVRLIVRPCHDCLPPPDRRPDSYGQWTVEGYVLCEGRWQKGQVQIIPLRENLFSRTRGLDTDILSDTRVLETGLGSVGSVLAEELAISGVGSHILLDHDRVEVANCARQTSGICDVDRYKTKVVAQRIYNKNPYAEVETHEVKISWQMQDFLQGLVRKADMVIGALDNREARIILNKICVQEKKPVIFMGASHRAYLLQILFVKEPGVSPCYQCFLMSLPRSEKAGGLESADLAPYADRPIAQLTPGLSQDIAPMNTMVAKLGTQELCRLKGAGDRSLEEDLIAPLWIYLNRREGPYAKLPPLGFNVGDKMSVLAWYGIDLKRNPACPICGDYEGEMSKKLGI